MLADLEREAAEFYTDEHRAEAKHNLEHDEIVDKKATTDVKV